jgi:hypothetical protein
VQTHLWLLGSCTREHTRAASPRDIFESHRAYFIGVAYRMLGLAC